MAAATASCASVPAPQSPKTSSDPALGVVVVVVVDEGVAEVVAPAANVLRVARRVRLRRVRVREEELDVRAPLVRVDQSLRPPLPDRPRAVARLPDDSANSMLTGALDALLAADLALKETRLSSDEQLLANLVLTLCTRPKPRSVAVADSVRNLGA
jgi:hypothetical protein